MRFCFVTFLASVVVTCVVCREITLVPFPAIGTVGIRCLFLSKNSSQEPSNPLAHRKHSLCSSLALCTLEKYSLNKASPHLAHSTIV
ncbi:hypothetical protein BC832DRAFT_552803 [Gaertneriomyces semiglobifer]|nr:hypothetical protein BC832DRAFT_552803 [Gaertneriomyces semiglobifer]